MGGGEISFDALQKELEVLDLALAVADVAGETLGVYLPTRVESNEPIQLGLHVAEPLLERSAALFQLGLFAAALSLLSDPLQHRARVAQELPHIAPYGLFEPRSLHEWGVTSWLSQNRRMSKDYERLPESSEAFIYVAMSRLMARRLARS